MYFITNKDDLIIGVSAEFLSSIGAEDICAISSMVRDGVILIDSSHRLSIPSKNLLFNYESERVYSVIGELKIYKVMNRKDASLEDITSSSKEVTYLKRVKDGDIKVEDTEFSIPKIPDYKSDEDLKSVSKESKSIDEAIYSDSNLKLERDILDKESKIEIDITAPVTKDSYGKSDIDPEFEKEILKFEEQLKSILESSDEEEKSQAEEKKSVKVDEGNIEIETLEPLDDKDKKISLEKDNNKSESLAEVEEKKDDKEIKDRELEELLEFEQELSGGKARREKLIEVVEELSLEEEKRREAQEKEREILPIESEKELEELLRLDDIYETEKERQELEAREANKKDDEDTKEIRIFSSIEESSKEKEREQEVDKLKEQSLQVQERVKQNLKEERDLPAIDPTTELDIEPQIKERIVKIEGDKTTKVDDDFELEEFLNLTGLDDKRDEKREQEPSKEESKSQKIESNSLDISSTVEEIKEPTEVATSARQLEAEKSKIEESPREVTPSTTKEISAIDRQNPQKLNAIFEQIVQAQVESINLENRAKKLEIDISKYRELVSDYLDELDNHLDKLLALDRNIISMLKSAGSLLALEPIVVTLDRLLEGEDRELIVNEIEMFITLLRRKLNPNFKAEAKEAKTQKSQDDKEEVAKETKEDKSSNKMSRLERDIESNQNPFDTLERESQNKNKAIDENLIQITDAKSMLRMIPPKRVSLNLEKVEAELGLPRDLILEFSKDFLIQSKEHLPSMIENYKAKDIEGIQKTAHMLKGAANNLRLDIIGENLLKLQKTTSITDVEKYIKIFIAHINGLERELKKLEKSRDEN